jgi:hypothetical protein
MGSWIRRQGPAFAVACLALMVALGGSVYAAAKIDGRAIKPGSLPGNRIKPGSVPGNRIAPGTIGGGRIEPGSLTGVQVDAATLGKVPEASRADFASTARSANTALAANTATEATHLNGRVATCAPTQRVFAGACWELQLNLATTAPQAAAMCANRGGELPAALALAAFGGLSGVELAAEGEWSGEVALISGPNEYSVLTVTRSRAVAFALSGTAHPYRCVVPLVS